MHLRTDVSGPDQQASAWIRLLGRVERSERLDPVVRAVEPAARLLVADRRVRDVLHGEATGIPLHIILTDVPLGAWFMAQFLDLFPDEGTRRAATRLVGLGVLSAAPVALSGWAEWALADQGTRRVGIPHAAVNATGTLIFLGSWAARSRGRHDLGVALARAGGAVLIAGAMVGGYLGRDRRPPAGHGRAGST